MSKSYEIRTVADFVKVPADRIDDCLAEFAVALVVGRMAAAISDQIKFPLFTWHDDGKKEAQINVEIGGESVTI